MAVDHVKVHGPNESVEYSHDWSVDLDDGGSPSDTISSTTWTLIGPNDGGSPSPEVYAPSQSVNVVTAWVRNLQHGGVYKLRHTTVTGGGRTFEHDWVIRCTYR